MKKSVKKAIIKFTSLLIVGVIFMLIANSAIFTHAHKLADGRVIIHAHPYDKSNDSSPFKSHQHSEKEYCFYKHLKIPFLIVFLSIAFIALLESKKVKYKLICKLILVFSPLQKGRSPPYSISIY